MHIRTAVSALPLLVVPTYAHAQADIAGVRAEARVALDAPQLTRSIGAGGITQSESDGANGVSFQGEVGYDHAMGAGSIGAYVGYGSSDAESCGLIGTIESCAVAGGNFWAGIRGGYRLGARQVFYLKGGYSRGEASIEQADRAVLDEQLSGYHLGAGIEIGVAGPFYGKIDYTYHNYGSADYAADPLDVSVSLERHMVAAGLGVRF